MRCLSEFIARLANAHLNPIRAGIDDSPEPSDYTSIQERLGIPVESGPEPDVEPGRPGNHADESEILPFAGDIGAEIHIM